MNEASTISREKGRGEREEGGGDKRGTDRSQNGEAIFSLPASQFTIERDSVVRFDGIPENQRNDEGAG